MKKVKEIDDEDEWSIKGFKSFSIAAVEYFLSSIFCPFHLLV